MNRSEKDESKARGGAARAVALSPERRKEIAQAAAASRWGSRPAKEEKVRPEKETAPKLKYIRVLAAKNLTVTWRYLINQPGTKVATITGNGVVRTIRGASDIVDERVQGYLTALQDLGIVLTVTYAGGPPPATPLEEFAV